MHVTILTQFDKTLTVKLDIKIPYSKAVQHRVSFEQILPPPLPLKHANKNPCKDMENVLRQHITYVKKTKKPQYIVKRHGT